CLEEVEVDAQEPDVPVVQRQRDLWTRSGAGDRRLQLEAVLRPLLLQRHDGPGSRAAHHADVDGGRAIVASPHRAGEGWVRWIAGLGVEPRDVLAEVLVVLHLSRDTRHHGAREADDLRMDSRDVLLA